MAYLIKFESEIKFVTVISNVVEVKNPTLKNLYGNFYDDFLLFQPFNCDISSHCNKITNECDVMKKNEDYH